VRARFDALTPREFEVFGHVVRGELNKQIAADLCQPHCRGLYLTPIAA
jgi:FixJ family two-component response regulator